MRSDVFEQVLEAELDELTRVKRWCHAALKIAVMVWQDFLTTCETPGDGAGV